LSRRAIAALIGIAFHKRRLHRVHFLRLTDALYGCDLIALVQGGEGETRKLALAIDVHRARAALAVIASLLRAGQVQMFTQTIEQRRARIDSQFIFLSIHPQGDGNCAFYRRHCFFRFRVAAGSARARSPNAGPAEASKLAIPNRERNERSVDCPNPPRASVLGFSGVFVLIGHVNLLTRRVVTISNCGKLLFDDRIRFCTQNEIVTLRTNINKISIGGLVGKKSLFSDFGEVGLRTFSPRSPNFFSHRRPNQRVTAIPHGGLKIRAHVQ